jgi:hypothetical protein
MTNHNKLSIIKGFTRIKEFPAMKRNTNFGKGKGTEETGSIVWSLIYAR